MSEISSTGVHCLSQEIKRSGEVLMFLLIS